MARVFAISIASFAVAVTACGSHEGAGTGNTGDGGNGDSQSSSVDAFTGPYSDFPAQPILDGSAGAGVGSGFASGSDSGAIGPCLVEPEVGTLFPNNWLRPRFTWVPSGSEGIYELELTAANEVNPLIVYTTNTTWTMPADIWSALSQHIVDAPITVTIRGAQFDGTSVDGAPDLGSTGDISIAPAAAPGAIVYWTTSAGTLLRGFHIGEETVHDIVTPTQAGQPCIGCHTSTPDGKFVGFSASTQADDGDPAELEILSADGSATPPSFISSDGAALMARIGQERPDFSARHYQVGDYTAIASYTVNGTPQIIWTDMAATSQTQGQGWDVLSRTTDAAGTLEANQAGYASFAHTSDSVIYVSAPSVTSGVTTTDGDIAIVPFANRAGGQRVLVPGASDPAYNEFYPTLSSDDQLIAFDRVGSGSSSYNDAESEVFVIPTVGGTAMPIAANQPPACSGKISPGVTNSWPRWAPDTTTVGAKTYYWLTFSSTRGALGNPQLYVTPVVVDGSVISTFPALYLWNQPDDQNNHTPAWDNFDIPIQ